MDFFIETYTFCIRCLNYIGHRIILFLCFLTVTFQNCFFTLQTKDTLTDFCLTDIKLFHHGIKSLCFTFGCRTAVENLNDLIFAVFHCLCTFIYIGDNIFERFCLFFQIVSGFF